MRRRAVRCNSPKRLAGRGASAMSHYIRYLAGCADAVSIPCEAFRLPSGCLLAGTTTLVPGTSFVDVGAITVTETPAGTLIVCEPPLYSTVMVFPAAPRLVPLVICAAPLVIR